MIYYGVEERRYVQSVHTLGALLYLDVVVFHMDISDVLRIVDDDPLSGYTIEDREIQLLIIGLQIHEQFVDFIYHLVYTGILLVYLVYQEDRIYSLLQRFLQYEPCLRHWAFAGIHQQYHRIHSLYDPLHLR